MIPNTHPYPRVAPISHTTTRPLEGGKSKALPVTIYTKFLLCFKMGVPSVVMREESLKFIVVTYTGKSCLLKLTGFPVTNQEGGGR